MCPQPKKFASQFPKKIRKAQKYRFRRLKEKIEKWYHIVDIAPENRNKAQRRSVTDLRRYFFKLVVCICPSYRLPFCG